MHEEIATRIWADTETTGTQKLILLAMLRTTDSEGRVGASQAVLSRLTGLDRRTITRFYASRVFSRYLLVHSPNRRKYLSWAPWDTESLGVGQDVSQPMGHNGSPGSYGLYSPIEELSPIEVIREELGTKPGTKQEPKTKRSFDDLFEEQRAAFLAEHPEFGTRPGE